MGSLGAGGGKSQYDGRNGLLQGFCSEGGSTHRRKPKKDPLGDVEMAGWRDFKIKKQFKGNAPLQQKKNNTKKTGDPRTRQNTTSNLPPTSLIRVNRTA